jgi:hypothetical protein
MVAAEVEHFDKAPRITPELLAKFKQIAASGKCPTSAGNDDCA